MKPILIYIAGAYSADTPEGIEQNIAVACEVAALVNILGKGEFFAVCPHTITYPIRIIMRVKGLSASEQFWIEGTMEIMLRCDAVLFLHGWEKSKGAKGEFEKAIDNKIATWTTLPPNPSADNILKALEWFKVWCNYPFIRKPK